MPEVGRQLFIGDVIKQHHVCFKAKILPEPKSFIETKMFLPDDCQLRSRTGECGPGLQKASVIFSGFEPTDCQEVLAGNEPGYADHFLALDSWEESLFVHAIEDGMNSITADSITTRDLVF